MLKIAVFPVAGFGTRFLPATKACPKEMLPVVDKPLIQYAVEEAYAAGLRTMVFITGRNKWAITEHYDRAYELESELERRGQGELLRTVQAVKPRDMDVIYIRQEQALGLGHAVLCARPITQNNPFAVLLADDLMVSEKPVLRQMVELYERHQQGVLAVMDVARAETGSYGIVSTGAQVAEGLYGLSAIVEKPAPAAAPSTLAVVGRYILPPAIMELLARTPRGAGGEIQLTDAIASLLREKSLLAYRFRGRRFDCGHKLGYLQANLTLGLAHENLAAPLRAYMEQLLRGE